MIVNSLEWKFKPGQTPVPLISPAKMANGPANHTKEKPISSWGIGVPKMAQSNFSNA
jgi:hypothetical protein